MKKIITILALSMITLTGFSQPFPNRTIEAGNLNLNYGLAAKTQTTASTTYTVTEDNFAVITLTDNTVFSLPTPSLVFNGKMFVIKAGASSTGSVNVIGGANIDAATSKTIAAGKCLIVGSDGTQYRIWSYNKYKPYDYNIYEEKNIYIRRRK